MKMIEIVRDYDSQKWEENQLYYHFQFGGHTLNFHFFFANLEVCGVSYKRNVGT